MSKRSVWRFHCTTERLLGGEAGDHATDGLRLDVQRIDHHAVIGTDGDAMNARETVGNRDLGDHRNVASLVDHQAHQPAVVLGGGTCTRYEDELAGHVIGAEVVDLARVGGRYSDEWHRVHLINPRDVVPESIMPGYPWLAETPADASDISKKMEVLRLLGAPYSDEDIANAPSQLEGKTEMDAMIAYLQGMGTAITSRR